MIPDGSEPLMEEARSIRLDGLLPSELINKGKELRRALRRSTAEHTRIMFALGDLANALRRRHGFSVPLTAQKIGHPERDLKNAAWKSRSIRPSLRRDAVPFSYYDPITRLTKLKRDDDVVRLLGLIEGDPAQWDRGRVYLFVERLLSLEVPVRNAGPIPSDRYAVFNVDLPWPVNGEVPYETMTRAEILGFWDANGMDSRADDDCVLFLWAPQEMLPFAFEVLTSWRFEYRHPITWDKVRRGRGFPLQGQTEFLLMATRGEPTLHKGGQFTDLIVEKRRGHSRKPEISYQLIEKICPGRKLELFGRQDRAGWDVWGDQVGFFSDEAAM